MTDKARAEPTVQEQIRTAFDADDKAVKNIILRRAADALDAKDAEIERLRKALRKIRDRDVPFYEGHRPNVCKHRRSNEEDCTFCTAEYARAAYEGGQR